MAAYRIDPIDAVDLIYPICNGVAIRACRSHHILKYSLEIIN